MLGAGFFGFFAHAGVLLALERAGVAPARVVGVSAGALAGGLAAAGLPAEALVRLLGTIEKRDFWDPGLPLGGLLRGARFEALLARQLAPLGVAHVEECRTPLTVLAARLLTRRLEPIDRGPLTTAIRASCAVPLLFRPVRHGGRLLVDGGVADRAGVTALADGERALVHDLPSRTAGSRWRRVPPPVAETGTRRVLRVGDLPAVAPDRLAHGAAATEAALRAAERWLAQPSPSAMAR